MANQQLADYIKQQMQLGVSKDAVKSALAGSGWPAGDIEEAMNAIPGAVAAPVGAVQSAQPAAAAVASSAAASTVQPTAKDIFPPKSSGSGSDIAGIFKPRMSVAGINPTIGASATVTGVAKGGSGKIGKVITWSLVGLLTASLLGLAAYFYVENGQLKETAAKTTSASSGLTDQVNALSQEKNQLLEQQKSLTAENSDLQTHLAFFVVPPGQGTSTPPITVTMQGVLSGSAKTGYILTTSRGVKIGLSNSKEEEVAAMLQAAGTATVTVAGLQAAGSKEVKVTQVNGTAVPEKATEESAPSVAAEPAKAAPAETEE